MKINSHRVDSILIVDDDIEQLNKLVNIIKFLGNISIHKISDANDAWSLIRIKDFDCVIASWEMSDMSGLALLRVLRNDDKYFDLPFFLSDTSFTRVKVIQAGQAGVTGLFVKPYNADNVKQKIEALSDPVNIDKSLEETKVMLSSGMKLIKNKQFDKALDLFKKMTEQGESAEYYYNIGYIKTVQGKYSEAIIAFKKATQIDRLYAKAFKAMGQVFKKMGKTKDAEKYLQKAVDLYMTEDKVNEAESILKELTAINPNTLNVYNSLGVLYRKKGELEKALKNYQKAIKIHPDEPNIYYNIGRLYLDLKDPDSAKDSFSKALEINPDFKEAKEVIQAITLGVI